MINRNTLHWKLTLKSQGVRILSGGIRTGGEGEVRLSVEMPRLSLICNRQMKGNKPMKTVCSPCLLQPQVEIQFLPLTRE